MWCADRDHGQLHRGASLRRAILPRRPCPAHRHRSACATSAEQGVPMKLHACTASLLVLAALLTGCQKSRSEEHTSELQSLMRISYAVFCLKKKNKKTRTTTNKD